MIKDLVGIATAAVFVACWLAAAVQSSIYWAAAAVGIGVVALVLLRPGKELRDPR